MNTWTDDEIADEAIRRMHEETPTDPEPEPEPPNDDGEPLFVDIAALLAAGLPKPPAPVLLTRADGHALLYASKVNVLFGDPESGKTWIALAACVEALRSTRRAAVIDLDHNGAAEIVTRLLMLGATPKQLTDPNLFRLTQPEDEDSLILAIAALRAWRPAVAVLDSIGELLPILRYSSNSPDDYTAANRRVLTPLANAGTAVVAIDHLPKNDEARSHGQTGTIAKKRTINGVSLHVTVKEPFAPGRGGSASMAIAKDRPGGLREHCPTGKNPPAGRFVMTVDVDGIVSWKVTVPVIGDEKEHVSDQDLAELDALAPEPRSQRDVQKRLGWGGDRAMKALQKWRDLRKQPDDWLDDRD